MASTSATSRPAVDAVRACLDKRLQVELSDGRTVEGRLECYDDSGNMILVRTTDVSSKVSPSSARERRTHFMGTVLVPGHVQVSVKVLRPPVPAPGIREETPLLHMRELRKELELEPVRKVEDDDQGDTAMEPVETDTPRNDGARDRVGT